MFALTKAASAAESGSNLQCKFSLQCFATVIHRKSLGKGPLAPVGISKKSYRLRTVKIKELIKCRQWWEGGGSSIKLEQEVLHPHSGWCWPLPACPGLPWQAQAWEGAALGAGPNLIQLCTLVATNLQHICSLYTIPTKKIVCTANLI